MSFGQLNTTTTDPETGEPATIIVKDTGWVGDDIDPESSQAWDRTTPRKEPGHAPENCHSQ